MKRVGLVCLCLVVWQFTVQAQTLAREQLAGTWIGVRIDYDEHFSKPFPVSMKLGKDSTYTLSLIDENPPVRQATWSMISQKIRLDTNTYPVNQWSLRGDELRLTGAYPVVFRRLTDIELNPNAVHKTLTDYKWVSDSLAYHFHDDGSACLEESKTGNVAGHCWRLTQIGGSVFLVIKGTFNDCEGNFEYPMQVTHVSSDKVEFLGGSRGTDHLVLRRGMAFKPNTHCQPKGFQPCTSYVFPSSNLYPYFSFQHGRLYDIRQVVERDYKPISKIGESGLIRFRFVVNCRGEAGNFEMLEVDENYQKRMFDNRITNQLLSICRDRLTDWEPGKRNDNQTPVDTFCLLTFRIKDGQITDIFP